MTIFDNDDVRLLKSTRDIWSEAQNLLSKKLSQPSFESWIRPAQLISYSHGEAMIAVSNEFMRGMVANNYIDALTESIKEVTQEKVLVKVIVDASAQSEAYTATIASITPNVPGSGYGYSSNVGHNQGMHNQGMNNQNLSNVAGAYTQPLSNDDGFHQVSSRGFSMPNLGQGSGQSAGANPGHQGQIGQTPVAGPGQNQSNQGYASQSHSAPSRLPDQVMASRSNLNNKYSFDTFVVGAHNRFSHSAAMAVAQKPGQAYNPLFIYGGVGLGKTHLMHAIGHEILKANPNASVRYISCEKFTNELINSIRDDRMSDFRKRYRQVDVLLVDDIQFLQGKESTQEEFFHTFNALRDSGKQIVLSSDRPPKAIAKLEERLRSRFEWGLIADIHAPDLETRLAILRKKCAMEHMRVADEVLEYIASLFTTNIRELEGALIRAHAYANLTGEPLSVSALAGMLQPSQPSKPKVTLTSDRIIETVAAHYRVEPSELRSAKRSQDLALPRHIAMYLAHDLMNMSFPRIGEAFGNRKHTSALYAHSRIKELILKDPGLAQSVKQITSQLAD
jgi:chromosomal replication initiator protein